MLVKVIILTVVFSWGNGLTSQQYLFPSQSTCESARVKWLRKVAAVSVQIATANCDDGYQFQPAK